MIVAGRGHERIQEYRDKRFSDRDNIIKSALLKNKSLSKNWKLNILKECINDKKLNKLKIF